MTGNISTSAISKHCLLPSHSATHPTPYWDHMNKECQCYFCLPRAQNATKLNPVVLCRLQSAQLLSLSCHSPWMYQPSKQSKLLTPSQLLQGLQDNWPVQGQEPLGQWWPPAVSQPASARQKSPFSVQIHNNRVKRQGRRRAISSHKYIHSTVFSSHFSITFLLYGP